MGGLPEEVALQPGMELAMVNEVHWAFQEGVGVGDGQKG